ncbi:GntR family transcriptional regulator [Pyramidobacter piscolens]|uniref:GntR family transcriptional regulator n=1 Tax=Pyramidobacter piscolens TaxID=638849 RepID=UPI001FCC9978|nr:GntR family transcriptional regulator [Pyramidobacter piscolens]BDF77547.1 GntR family transcriptional regulator [Pyramidobacter piscolens]
MTIPLYYQIYRDLQYKICEGIYKPGSMLPRESDLEKIYGTSRAPVRQALGALENEGLISRQQGKGTFVTQQVRTRPWFTATGFVNVYERYWDKLSTKTLELALKVPEDQSIRDFLNLKEQEQATYLVRSQCIEETPVFIFEHYLLPRFDLSVFQSAKDFISMKEILASKFNTMLSKVHEKLAVRTPPKRITDYLKIPEHTPVLRVRRFLSDNQGKPVWVSNQYVFTDKWEYETDSTLNY